MNAWVRPRGRAIARLRALGPTPEAVDAWLTEHPVPVVEGSACTFVWRGEADAVGVEHRAVGLPEPLMLRRMRNSDLWYATVEVPRGARIEYRILIRRGGDVENTLDPLNPRQAPDPITLKSVLEADGYETPDWTQPDPAVVPGELVDIRVPSRHLKRDVRVTLYLPMRMRRRDRLPLLVLNDGGDYLQYSGMATVFDNLMHRRMVADTVVALVHPADRMVEYIANPAHARFITGELVPRLEKSLPLRGDAPGRVLGGASLGAIAALNTAVRAPGHYGALLLQSATFIYKVIGQSHDEGPVLDRVIRFVNALRADPVFVAEKIFLSVGAFEPSADRNRAMVATLNAMAGQVRVGEGLDGHNWTSWRDRMLDGLGWLLPGDARLVYP